MPAATFSTVSPIISGAMPAAASTTSAKGRRKARGCVRHSCATTVCMRALSTQLAATAWPCDALTEAPEHIAARVLEGLALLLGHQLGEVVLRNHGVGGVGCVGRFATSDAGASPATCAVRSVPPGSKPPRLR